MSRFILFCLCMLFIFLGALLECYALNLEPMKIDYLKGDYQQALQEGERIIATASRNSSGLDELYYFLGLSYLKVENYLRASDVFEILCNEFKQSRFLQRGRLGMADSYYLRNDFSRAEREYTTLLTDYPDSVYRPLVHQRLAQLYLRRGDAQQTEFFSVQVGSFSQKANAENLRQKLKQQGYSVYIEEAAGVDAAAMYRVKIGKLKSREEASKLKETLSGDGYPTKICP